MKATVTIYLLDYPISFGEAIMEQHSEYLLFSNVLSLVSAILVLVWVFMFRGRFNTFLANSPNQTSELGPVLTFSFKSYTYHTRSMRTLTYPRQEHNERIQPTEKSAARSSLCFFRRPMRSVSLRMTKGTHYAILLR